MNFQDGSYCPEAVRAIWLSTLEGPSFFGRYYDDRIKLKNPDLFTGAVSAFVTMFAETCKEGTMKEFVLGSTRYLIRENELARGLMAVDANHNNPHAFYGKIDEILDYTCTNYGDMLESNKLSPKKFKEMQPYVDKTIGTKGIDLGEKPKIDPKKLRQDVMSLIDKFSFKSSN